VKRRGAGRDERRRGWSERKCDGLKGGRDDRPLPSWTWRAEERDHVAVATDTRVLGHACRERTTASLGLPLDWREGQTRKLLPSQRREMGPWVWNGVSTVEIPWEEGGWDRLRLEPDERSLLDEARHGRAGSSGCALPAAGRWSSAEAL
jgi:hypothetical protein